MKQLKWILLTLLGCLLIGLITRIPALRIYIYGIHCVIAAPFMSLFLYWRFSDGGEHSLWVKISPLLFFGLFLGSMTPIMGFYSIGATLLATFSGLVWQGTRSCAVMAVVYAGSSYPLCLLREVVVNGSAIFTMEALLLMVLSLVLSILGVWLGKHWNKAVAKINI